MSNRYIVGMRHKLLTAGEGRSAVNLTTRCTTDCCSKQSCVRLDVHKKNIFDCTITPATATLLALSVHLQPDLQFPKPSIRRTKKVGLMSFETICRFFIDMWLNIA
ncbi:hypothetical protein KZ483_14810 [Paenibacillus sp. sptzw28]|uniref:hypothetical protein n=1 Tax=Paenibacillus sp. sptzw28 TaxID=715179 RepID=UPI001C6F5A34|nr:hypothetical protein [Paenibacillus sp. sptzw28]QYR19224.1 hypothetical protein KZ483_14810 [Paenibacillus sp. sptzw28]